METTPQPSSCAPRRAGGQGGSSLLEVIIAVALAGTVVLSLAAGLLTLVRAEAATSERQRVQQSLNNFSEGLRSVPYVDCTTGGATADAYRTSYDANPLNWQPDDTPGMKAFILGEIGSGKEGIIDVGYWNPVSKTFADTCSSADQGAQELTIEVTWRDRKATSQVVVGDR